MGDGDNPTFYNYELQGTSLCGDDQDDLVADVEELLGDNVDINFDVDEQGLPEGQAAHSTRSKSVSTGSTSGIGASKKRRQSTSKVWNEFEAQSPNVARKQLCRYTS